MPIIQTSNASSYASGTLRPVACWAVRCFACGTTFVAGDNMSSPLTHAAAWGGNWEGGWCWDCLIRTGKVRYGG